MIIRVKLAWRLAAARFFKTVFAVFFLFLAIFCRDCFGMGISAGSLSVSKKIKNMKEIKDKNVVKQSLDYSCGPAGLATILNYFLGDKIGEKDIINVLLKTTSMQKVMQRKGFSLLDLKKFAQDRGYTVTGYKMDIDFLRKLNKPTLVPIKFKNYRHFIVIKGVIGDRVFVADPTVGNTTMKINYFTRIWQEGIGLVVEREIPRDPFVSPLLTNVGNKDMVIVDYQSMERMLGTTVLRTAVFPNEF